MPEFTVHEGGGGGGFDEEHARYQLRIAIVELLRALARGSDPENRVLQALDSFKERAALSRTPASALVRAELADCFQEAFETLDEGGRREDARTLVRAAFRVGAEALAIDPAAKGRLSSREEDLQGAIKQFVLSMEERSRRYGWSYVHSIVGHLPPIEPAPSPARKRRPIR